MGDLQRPARLYEDNSAAIALGKELKTRSSARHYVLRLRWLQMAVVEGRLHLVHCPTKLQIADIMTKALCKEDFIRLRGLLMGHDDTGARTLRQHVSARERGSVGLTSLD